MHSKFWISASFLLAACLLALKTSCSATSNEDVSFAAEGEQCSKDSQCPSGTACVHTSDGSSKHCYYFRAENESCFDTHDCSNNGWVWQCSKKGLSPEPKTKICVRNKLAGFKSDTLCLKNIKAQIKEDLGERLGDDVYDLTASEWGGICECIYRKSEEGYAGTACRNNCGGPSQIQSFCAMKALKDSI